MYCYSNFYGEFKVKKDESSYNFVRHELIEMFNYVDEDGEDYVIYVEGDDQYDKKKILRMLRKIAREVEGGYIDFKDKSDCLCRLQVVGGEIYEYVGRIVYEEGSIVNEEEEETDESMDVKLEVNLTLAPGTNFKSIKKELESHVENLLDLDEWPEIESVYNVEINRI